jgi:predicted TIM-barrel fold metal-dependent hydrolase
LIIDTHTHLLGDGHWPEEWWDWVAADWASKEPGRSPADVRARIEPGLLDDDGSRMIARMDEAGVDASVLLPIDWGPDYTTRTPITDVVDQMLELGRRYDGRLIPFGGIDPRHPNAVELVSNWFDRGARGLKLYPGCGWDPVSPEAMEVYDVCEQRQRPVLFHTGDPLPLLDTELSDPERLNEIPRRFPDLPIWLGHAGAPDRWEQAIRLAQAGPRVRLEMSVWLWDDSTEEDEIEFARKMLDASDRVGIDRIIFGTDHVSGNKIRPDGFLPTVTDMFRRLPRRCIELGAAVTPDQMDAIMGGTAAKDLGLT